MLDWLDVAYATSTLVMIFYCFRVYFLSKKRPFQLFGLGFTFLLVSNFLWVLSFIPGLNEAMAVFSYIRLGIYTIFVLLSLRAIQLLNSNRQVRTQ